MASRFERVLSVSVLVLTLACIVSGQTNAYDVVTFGTPNGAVPYSGVVSLCQGDMFGVALMNTGALQTWGSAEVANNVPAVLTNGTRRVSSLACGASHVVAVLDNAAVVAWGTSSATAVPSDLASGTKRARSACAGMGHSLVLLEDGAVTGWGSIGGSQIQVPSALRTAGAAKAVACGYQHSLVLQNSGLVVAIGDNSFGQTTVPAAARTQGAVLAVAAAGSASYALLNNGSALHWGADAGQSDVARVKGLIRSLAAGVNHVVALLSSGQMMAFGPTTSLATIVPAAGQTGVLGVAAGGSASFALKALGSVALPPDVFRPPSPPPPATVVGGGSTPTPAPPASSTPGTTVAFPPSGPNSAAVVNPAVDPNVPAPVASATSDGQAGSTGGMKAPIAAIAGGVAGGVALLGMVVTLGACVCFRRRTALRRAITDVEGTGHLPGTFPKSATSLTVKPAFAGYSLPSADRLGVVSLSLAPAASAGSRTCASAVEGPSVSGLTVFVRPSTSPLPPPALPAVAALPTPAPCPVLASATRTRSSLSSQHSAWRQAGARAAQHVMWSVQQVAPAGSELSATETHVVTSDSSTGEGLAHAQGVTPTEGNTHHGAELAAPAGVAGHGASAQAAMLDNLMIGWSDLRIAGHLGSGGMGTVYKGTWKGHRVAIKMLTMDGGAGPGTTGTATAAARAPSAMMRHEALIMSQMCHPSVARVFGLVDDGTHHALVMACYKRGSLAANMSTAWFASLSAADRLRLGLQVAGGMCYLHERRPTPVLHGDLKTANLLLEDDGRVVLADFGLAGWVHDPSAAMQRGSMTISISPPEVLADPRAPRSAPTDVYSFAVVLLEIMTGRPAFQGMRSSEVRMAVIMGERPAIPPSVPAAVADVIRACWAQEPAARPPFPTVLRQLESALSELQGAGWDATVDDTTGLSDTESQ